MSDIAEARRILKGALKGDGEFNAHYHYAIMQALPLLDREKPKFVAARKTRKLTPYNVDYARHLRATGMSLNDIAVKLKTNGGRISEACA